MYHYCVSEFSKKCFHRVKNNTRQEFSWRTGSNKMLSYRRETALQRAL